MQTKPFKLEYLGEETHLLLPNVTSIILAQNLYDVLFQYVISPEKEEMLISFIKLLETHIKSKSRAPFSLPLSDLAFLDEGLQELRLLNWMEVPVSLFHISLSADASEEDYDNTYDFLKGVLTFNKKIKTNDIYVYPLGLTAY
ncbi:MAG TPA: hypothetical protein PKN87_00280 [Syntrophomonadaceae bacterium]|nr:hypothetical protein [Syntrophomonadaceae bacterium]HNX27833.1 hypothetical protein [Syntrophomonadaceae bacterium]HPR93625.1 hypothetical protein [Syntrophomonadaceae bacterium]